MSQSIEAEAAKRVEHYATAMIANRFSETSHSSVHAIKGTAEGQQNEYKGMPLQWNPGSPISARTLILAAENRMGQINEAILICAPPSTRKPVAELSLTDIEVMVNDHIKGWFLLVKELSLIFRVRQSGTLALVYSDVSAGGGRDDTADILGPAAHASFQAFTRSILQSAQAEPYITLGFSCTEPGAEAGFASYIFKILDEGNKRNKGKLHKYGKLSFLK